jgi:bacterioferritin-associated ferredoxin
MIVCHCHALTDRDIRRACEQGSKCPEDVARRCRAGSQCGGCRSQVQLILRGTRKGKPPTAVAS